LTFKDEQIKFNDITRYNRLWMSPKSDTKFDHLPVDISVLWTYGHSKG